MGKWHRAVNWMMAAVFAAGLCVFLYPILRGRVLDRRISESAQSFLMLTASQTAPLTPQDAQTEEPQADADVPSSMAHQELWDAVNAYNQRIWAQRQSGLTDPWAYQQPSFVLEDHGLEDEVFAVISIPAIELEMPIYLGASYEHLSLGAAHLSQTSLPVGGRDTNCVVAGHRGWHNGRYFCSIVDLKPGDMVQITNMWETLLYRVCDTRIIGSHEIDKIKIQEGRDMLTLLTCYYANDGHKMRFVCYCERICDEPNGKDGTA